MFWHSEALEEPCGANTFTPTLPNSDWPFLTNLTSQLGMEATFYYMDLPKSYPKQMLNITQKKYNFCLSKTCKSNEQLYKQVIS